MSGEIIRVRSKQRVHFLQGLRIEVGLSDESNDCALVAPCQRRAGASRETARAPVMASDPMADIPIPFPCGIGYMPTSTLHRKRYSVRDCCYIGMTFDLADGWGFMPAAVSRVRAVCLYASA
jgi:hypothetical protein